MEVEIVIRKKRQGEKVECVVPRQTCKTSSVERAPTDRPTGFPWFLWNTRPATWTDTCLDIFAMLTESIRTGAKNMSPTVLLSLKV